MDNPSAWQWLAVLFGGAWITTMGFIARAVLQEKKSESRRGRNDSNANIEISRIGAAERMANQLMERQGREIHELQDELRELRARDAEIRALLYGLTDDLVELRQLIIDVEHPRGGEIDLKRMEMEERVRRGRSLWDTEGVA